MGRRHLSNIIAGTILVFGAIWAAARLLGRILSQIVGAPGFIDDASTWEKEWLPVIANYLIGINEWLKTNGYWILIVGGSIGLLWSFLGGKISQIIYSHLQLPLEVPFNNRASLDHVRGEPFIRAEVFCKTKLSKAMTIKRYYIPVENTTNKTVDDVKVILHSGGIPIWNYLRTLPHESGKESISIAPKQTEFFLLGCAYFNELYPAIPDNTSMSQEQIDKTLEQNRVWSLVIPQSFGKGPLPFLRNDDQKLLIQIFGRNVPPTYVRFRLDGKEKTKLFILDRQRKEWDLSQAYKSGPAPKIPTA